MIPIYQAKREVRIFKVILMLLCMLSFTTAKGYGPDSAGNYKKILVLAKIEQPNLKKQFEEAVVSQLNKKGYEAVPSGSVITSEDLENMEALADKVESLGIDAVLAYTIENVETQVTNTPSVHASVGVPVRVGFMNVYLGGSVPLGGGPKQEKIIRMKAGFYNDRTSTEPAFTMDLSGKLDNGTDVLINNFSRKSVKALLKSGLF